MQIEPLAIAGAFKVTAEVFSDDRGGFHEWFRPDQLLTETGMRFEVAQANESTSRYGVLRGIHFADVPPGQAKWVRCTSGSVVDVVVDLRLGSPTFGAHDAVVLDASAQAPTSVVIAEGLGHAFCVTSETAVVSYLLTSTYNPAAEHGITPLDDRLGITWPVPASECVLSEKDRDAPTLAEAVASGGLPAWVG